MSILILLVCVVGFSGTASAVAHVYECPFCCYATGSQAKMESHLTGCHGVGVVTIQGEKGEKGDKGDTGAAGTNGTNGKDGKDGVAGVNGKDGVVDYSKVQSMINSATSGLQAQINSINNQIKNIWSEIDWIIDVNVNQINLIDDHYAEFQASIAAQADVNNDLSNRITNIQLTPGPKGDTGAQGPQGIQGEQGIQGLQGIQGVAGIDGINGLNGLNGANGLNGHDGVTKIVHVYQEVAASQPEQSIPMQHTGGIPTGVVVGLIFVAAGLMYGVYRRVE